MNGGGAGKQEFLFRLNPSLKCTSRGRFLGTCSGLEEAKRDLSEPNLSVREEERKGGKMGTSDKRFGQDASQAFG